MQKSKKQPAKSQAQKKQPGKKTPAKSLTEAPEFPERNAKDEIEKETEIEAEEKDTGLGISEEELKFNDEDLIEIVKDLIGAGFDAWHLANPNIEKIDDRGKDRIAKPVARVIIRRNLSRFIKDEFLALFWIGIEISKRIKIKKKGDEKDDSRPNGDRKDELSEATD